MPSRAEDLFRQIEGMSEADRTTFVEAWVTKKQQENSYLDFKCSGGDDKDAQTLSRHLSSFGNTEGGILVWGIDARQQKATNPGERAVDEACDWKPVRDTRQHIQLLKDKLRDSTNEPIQGVEYLSVTATKGPGGYVVTLIPEGKNKPYRAERMTGRPYYQRIGDNNEIIPHNLLRLMFYPMTKPVLHFRCTVDKNGVIARISVEIANRGTATANDLNLKVTTNREVRSILGSGTFRTDHTNNLMTQMGRARSSEPLHPGDDTEAFVIHPGETSDFIAGLLIHMTVFMKDQEPQNFEATLGKDSIIYGRAAEFSPVDFPATTAITTS